MRICLKGLGALKIVSTKLKYVKSHEMEVCVKGDMKKVNEKIVQIEK